MEKTFSKGGKKQTFIIINQTFAKAKHEALAFSYCSLFED